MDKILEHLKDPAWWFTAVIVAIFASLLAAYLKEWINRRISAWSNRYSQWRERRNKLYEAKINGIVNDPTLLIIAKIHVVLLIATLSGLIIGMFTLGLVGFGLKSQGQLGAVNKLSIFSFITLAYVSVNFVTYKLGRQLLLTWRVERRYEWKKNKATVSETDTTS